MQLSPFVTALWLLWLLLILGKISLALNPNAKLQTAKDSARAFLVIVGAYVARVASDDCSDSADVAFAYVAAAADLAIVADAIFKPIPGQFVRPGTAVVISASVITVAEVLLRASEDCYSVAAPAVGASAVLGIVLSSYRKRI